VLGHSGSGKSTLAAELHRRGLDVLSDDVVPIDDDGNALPGHPRIKLWQDALVRLGRGTEGLERVDEGHEKFHVPLDRAPLRPLPVRALYVLERVDADELRLEPVAGAVAFALLHEHSYRNELLVGDAAVRHLEQCSRLAGSAKLARVARPYGRMTVEETADAILTDLGAHQGDPA
jgi:hypothetical protein